MLPKSLIFRFFFSECLILAIFFALVVVAFGFDFGIKQAAIDRLQFQRDMIKSIAEVTQLKLPEKIAQSDFDTPASGHYAFIHLPNANPPQLWSSASAGKMTVPVSPLASNECWFWLDSSNPGFERYVLQCGANLTITGNNEHNYVITIMEKKWFVMNQLDNLQKTLKYWLLGLGLILVTVKFLVLRFSLKPLHTMVGDLKAIDEGKKTLLDGEYTLELQGLAHTLNTLIIHERFHTERQRNRLAHLAHSIKTPLTILRGYAQLFAFDHKNAVNEEISRIDAIIEFQLQRAIAKAEDNVINKINVVAIIEQQCTNLKKAYSNKDIHFDRLGDQEPIYYYCQEAELNEIIGNLMDNACKWCSQRIKISITQHERKDRHDYSLVVHIEDDGPGIPAGKYHEILKWGGRADGTIKGHGIGVYVVNELVGMLGGLLQGGASPSLGGMRWRIYLP